MKYEPHVPLTVKGFHSTDRAFDVFDLAASGSNHSTYLEAAYFADRAPDGLPKSGRVIEAEITMQKPFVLDVRESRFDSAGMQEAIDAALRGGTSYLVDDLVAHGAERGQAEDYVESLAGCDGIILENTQYDFHSTEFVLPAQLSRASQIEIKAVRVAPGWTPEPLAPEDATDYALAAEESQTPAGPTP